MLEHAVAYSWERRHDPELRRVGRVVVVVDPSVDRRRSIGDALRAAGWPAREVATPLEAIDLIVHERDVAAVAIARTTRTQTHAEELAAFVTAEHPTVRVTLIPDEGARIGAVLKDLLARL